MFCEQPMVLLRNVASDSNREQPVQSCFLSAFPATISQDSVLTNHKHVGDELLVSLVEFCLAAIPVDYIFRRRRHWQVLLHIETDALEHAQLFEQFSFETKHSFFCCHSS